MTTKNPFEYGKKKSHNQSGQVLVIVMILVLLCSIIIAPLLAFMGTGIKTGQFFEKKTAELYAADAGIEDGVYQIKYDKLKIKFPSYSAYNYSNPSPYLYDLNNPVNGINPIHVSIRNIWIPAIAAPTNPSAAEQLVNNGRLIITGGASGSNYKIKITYNDWGADDSLEVISLGVWLPGGFSYVAGSSDLEIDSTKTYYTKLLNHAPTISDRFGGKAVVWDFMAGTIFAGSTTSPLQDAFPNFTHQGSQYTSSINFTFTTPSSGAAPSAVAWVTTKGIDGYHTDPYSYYAWDADQKVYSINSNAGGTSVDSYVAKNELRYMQSAIAGDYYATGNSALSDTDSDRCRETPRNPSSANVTSSNIPSEADVALAYLYWTGWKNESSSTFPLDDTCSSFSPNWSAGSSWSINSGTFRGHYDATHTGTDLTLVTKNLSTYPEGGATIFWDQWVTSPNTSITFQAAGTYARRSSGNVIPSLPSGWAQNDVWICVVASADNVNSTMPSGWEAIDAGTNNGSGLRTSVFWHRVGPAGSESSPTVTHSGGSYISAYIVGYRGCVTSGSPIDVSSSTSVNSSSSTLTFCNSGTPTITDKDMVVLVGGTSAQTTSSGYTGSPTPQERVDGTNTANYPENIVADFTLATAGNIGQRKSTLLTSRASNGIAFALKPDTSAVDAVDGVDFAFSSDNGGTWGTAVQAFRGNIGSTAVIFSHTIPKQYLTSTFKIKLTLVGFNGTGEYCNLDNIRIVTADTSVVFKIDDTGSGVLANAKQVYLDSGGLPQQGSQELIASKSQIVENFQSGTTPHGYSYSSMRDVTSLVRAYSKAPTVPNTNWPGYASYWVGNVYADASPEDEWAYASWSLLIVYTSANTQGHMLYLYDHFTYSNQDTTHGVNVDFDGDGQPGGTISSFIVPNRLTGVAGITVTNQGNNYSSAPTVVLSGGGGTGATAVANVVSHKITSIAVTNQGIGYTSAPTVTITDNTGTGATGTALLDANVGKITTFVGEGDVWYTGDFMVLNGSVVDGALVSGTKLWDGVTCSDNSKTNADNIFNSTSLGLNTYDGIDIDTFGVDPPNGQYITWDSGMLHSGDTSAQIDLVTHQDVWNLVYIIISFRSETSTGGALSYLIR